MNCIWIKRNKVEKKPKSSTNTSNREGSLLSPKPEKSTEPINPVKINRRTSILVGIKGMVYTRAPKTSKKTTKKYFVQKKLQLNTNFIEPGPYWEYFRSPSHNNHNLVDMVNEYMANIRPNRILLRETIDVPPALPEKNRLSAFSIPNPNDNSAANTSAITSAGNLHFGFDFGLNGSSGNSDNICFPPEPISTRSRVGDGTGARKRVGVSSHASSGQISRPDSKRILKHLNYSDFFGNSYMKANRQNRSLNRDSKIGQFLSRLRCSKSSPFLKPKPKFKSKPKTKSKPKSKPKSKYNHNSEKVVNVSTANSTSTIQEKIASETQEGKDEEDPRYSSSRSKSHSHNNSRKLNVHISIKPVIQVSFQAPNSRQSPQKDVRALREKLQNRLSNIKDLKSRKHYRANSGSSDNSSTYILNEKAKISIKKYHDPTTSKTETTVTPITNTNTNPKSLAKKHDHSTQINQNSTPTEYRSNPNIKLECWIPKDRQASTYNEDLFLSLFLYEKINSTEPNLVI